MNTNVSVESLARPDPRSLSTAELVAHIVESHHAYLRSALPFLVTLTAKVARVHGDHDPRLRELQAEFVELRESLDLHLDQEEEVLFREVVADRPDAAVLRRELEGMHVEHAQMFESLGHIRALCDGYTPPEWACNSYRRLLTELAALEKDVLQHVQLEDGVLLPRFGVTP